MNYLTLFMLTCVLMLASVVKTAHAVDSTDPLAGKPPFRRLFLDAMVVEESRGLERVFHAAEKHSKNPVLPGDEPWEGWGPYLYGTVLSDEGKLKMWYQCIGIQGGGGLRSCSCYAESADGIAWKKPDLGIVEFNGSKANNMICGSALGLPAVMKVPESKSPDRKWVAYGWGGEAGPRMAYSPDGIRFGWDENEKHQKLFSSSDVVNFFFDPYKNRYVSTYKTSNRRHRAVGLAFSDDGETWRKPIEGAVFGADDLDPDATQVYGMPVFPYQGMYIGLPWIYHARWIKYGKYESPRVMYEAQEGSPCTVDVQFAWSWDLLSWNRTPKREPFIALGSAGSFDCGQIYTARAPVQVGDKLFFYYGGFNKIHDDYRDVRGAIGLATLRLDGFCSMQAGDKEGWLISRREVFKTPEVTINARTAPNGYVAAELLDRNNRVIRGFSREECIPFKGDSVRQKLTWKTNAFPAELLDKDKKIRFFIRNADLYSYLPADIDSEKDDGWADY